MAGQSSTSLDLFGERILGCIFERELGSGTGGTVYKARNLSNRGTSEPYVAIKVICRKSYSNLPWETNVIPEQIDEIQIHFAASKLSSSAPATQSGPSQDVDYHPHIVRPIDCVKLWDVSFLIMDYYAQGDLFENIGPFYRHTPLIRRAFKQILSAVSRCHSQNIYCLDLKAENIMVDREFNVYVTDFGTATSRPEVSGSLGSLPYMSPEALVSVSNQSWYDPAAHDVWALGVILVNLVTSRSVWRGATLSPSPLDILLPDSLYAEYFHAKDRGLHLSKGLHVSEPLGRLLARIFEPIPANRIKLEDLREAFDNFIQLYPPSLESSDSHSNIPSPTLLSNHSLINAVNASIADVPERPEDQHTGAKAKAEESGDFGSVLS